MHIGQKSCLGVHGITGSQLCFDYYIVCVCVFLMICQHFKIRKSHTKILIPDFFFKKIKLNRQPYKMVHFLSTCQQKQRNNPL